MASEPCLNSALHELLYSQRTAALGTLDALGKVFVSRVPFAMDSEQAELVIHVSALAAHTQHLLLHPRASVLVAQAEVAGEPVHALARVTIEVQAQTCEPRSSAALRCQTVYLARFPQAEPMTQLGDFRFVRLSPQGARHVAGFGAARSLDAAKLIQAIRAAPS